MNLTSSFMDITVKIEVPLVDPRMYKSGGCQQNWHNHTFSACYFVFFLSSQKIWCLLLIIRFHRGHCFSMQLSVSRAFWPVFNFRIHVCRFLKKGHLVTSSYHFGGQPHWNLGSDVPRTTRQSMMYMGCNSVPHPARLGAAWRGSL